MTRKLGCGSFLAGALLSYLIIPEELVLSLTKVVVPAVYKEWTHNKPEWAVNRTIKARYGYSTFVYQKLDPKSPNYISKNRGCEAGPYFRYIVDHYHSFPDVAVFVHARPDDHSDNWLGMVRCISPNATYMSLNLDKRLCRSSWNGLWARYAIWIEQCLRDTLKIVWNLNSTVELNERLPTKKPINICLHCCQQFILSRSMVHTRPLSVWKQLQKMLTEQDVCHTGDPDYENLFAFNHSQRLEVGPEPSEFHSKRGGGRYTQGLASEHLSHVIFGHQPIEMKEPTMEEICQNFLLGCPGSPCNRTVLLTNSNITRTSAGSATASIINYNSSSKQL